MIINHNLAGNNAISRMNTNSLNASKSMQKLSSGLRINSAADDAAGLAISEKMRGQIRGLDQASANAQDGISMVQTAEGALGETTSILQRMRELATQASNDTNTSTDRKEIQKEISQLTTEINRIGNTTEFNTQKLLDGSKKTTTTGGTALSFTTVSTGKAAVASAVAGVYTIAVADVTGGDVLGGVAFTTGTTAATDIIGQLAANTGFNANFSAVSTGTSIKITAKSGHETTALTVSAGITTKAIVTTGKAVTSAVAGSYTIAASGLAGDTVGGVTLTDAATTASAVIAQLNTNATFSTKFTAAVTGTSVKITAKSGHEATALTGTDASVTSGGVTFQIGANGGQGMTIEINDMRATSTGTNGLKIANTTTGTVTSKSGKVAYYASSTTVSNGTDNNALYRALDVSTNGKATAAIDVLNDAIETVSGERSRLGAYQNRLEHTINNLGTSSENLTSAESRIRDVDMAKEMSTFSKNNILSQAAQAMLAQANQQPQQVLQLLR